MIFSWRFTALLPILLIATTIMLVSAGFMHIFASRSGSTNIAQQVQLLQQPTETSQSFTVFTLDRQFTVTFTVTPNHTGPNVFTVSVIDTATGLPLTNAHASLSTTMLDMKMGTQTITLQSDGKGHFSARGDLSMGGDWGIGISIQTPDHVLHQANINLLTPA
jgi:hypothetical protein